MTRRASPGAAWRMPGRAGRFARGAAAFCALAGFTGAVPAGLLWYTGWPWPRRVPAWPALRTALMTPLSETAILKVLACTLWLAWAMFTVAVAAEIIAALRGCPAPRLLVFPPAQALAAALVSALAITSAPVPYGIAAVIPAAAASRVPVPAVAASQPAQQAPAPVAALRAAGPPGGAAGTGSRACRQDTGGSTATRTVYRVVPGDNLWDIAGADLGNPELWHEIFALNRGRPQPDGRSLTDPARIYPGWVLLLPSPSAAPPRPVTPPHPSAAGHAPGSRHSQPPGLRPRGRHRPAAGTSTPAAHPSRPAARRSGPAGIDLPGGGLAGITLAAAISAAAVLAGVQRRRRYRPGITATSSLQPGEPPLPAVITALRRAATPRAATPRAATTQASGWLAASTPARSGSLPLAAAPGASPGPVPCPGPHGRDPGRGQETLSGAAMPAGLGVDGAPLAAQPGRIPLGVRDGNEISADIAAMGGLGLTGPGAPAAARAILAALLGQAVPGQPSGPAEIIMAAADAAVLFPGPGGEGLTAARIPGLIITPGLDEALGHAEALIVRRARMTGSHETGEDTGPGAAARPLPAAALIAALPRSSQRLRGVLESGRGPGLAGIVLGDWPPGSTCHVAAGGVTTCADPALDGIQMFHLDAAGAATLTALIQAACGNPASDETSPPSRPAGPPPAWGTGTPGSAARAVTAGTTQQAPATANSPNPGHPIPPGGRTPIPAPETAGPPPAGERRHPGSCVIGVDVLGPLRITAAGGEIHGGLRKARELLAFLAVHPGGVSGEAISEALWPDSPPGHGTRQRSLALRKLRDMLRSAAGLAAPMFVILAGDRYRLDPSLVATDAAAFQAALDDARHAPDDTIRLAALQRAAALYRGPLAEGAGYDWAEPYAETARRRALDAWTRIAELLEPAGPDQALAALETALGHDPYNEYLYQRIMQLQAAAGRPDAVRRTLQLLETRLTEIGVTPAPQTRQAAAALLGMPSPPQRGGAGPQPPEPPRPGAAGRERSPGRRPAR